MYTNVYIYIYTLPIASGSSLPTGSSLPIGIRRAASLFFVAVTVLGVTVLTVTVLGVTVLRVTVLGVTVLGVTGALGYCEVTDPYRN